MSLEKYKTVPMYLFCKKILSFCFTVFIKDTAMTKPLLSVKKYCMHDR